MKLLIPPPLIALLTGFIMWGLPKYFDILLFSFSGRQMVAYILVAIGLSFDVISIIAFRKAKTTVTPLQPEKTSELVVSGLYRISRNPMYLGLALILTGWMIFIGALMNIAILLLFIAYITMFQIKPEEERLEQLFGAQYSEYKKRVRRWV